MSRRPGCYNAAMVGAILPYFAFTAAALETAIAGAPIRWLVVVVAALYQRQL